MEDKRRYRCCFTGHRPEKMDYSKADVKRRLDIAVDNAINDGYKTFIVGMCRGVDLWAGEIIIGRKANNPDLHLIAAIPHPDFEKRWNDNDKELYFYVLNNADITRTISASYYNGCYQKRNIWMCDRASRLIAAYTGISGGTKNTVNYAKSKGLDIINIFEFN